MSEELTELMGRKELLTDELLPYLFDEGPLGKMIHHPLVIEIHVDWERCALVNKRFQLKKQAVSEALARGDWAKIIWLHERPYRLEALADIKDKVQLNELPKLIGSVWIDSENIWQHQAVWLALWNKLPEPLLTMDEEERTAFAALPERLAIYRGIRAPRFNRRGLSWTLDRDKALWFARRHLGRGEAHPTLLKGEVSKRDIFAHFTGRGENEIVVSPRKIQNLQTEGLS